MNVIICGTGRAGLELTRTLSEIADINIQAGVCRAAGRKAGQDLGLLAGAGRLGAPIVSLDHFETALQYFQPDVVVDFSRPATSLQVAEICSRAGVSLLVGTTGFTRDEVKRMKDLALSGSFALLYAPNIAQGVNVLNGMVCYSARHLSGLDFQTEQASLNPSSALRMGSGTAAASRVIILRETVDSRPFAGSVVAALQRLAGQKGWMEMIDVIGFR